MPGITPKLPLNKAPSEGFELIKTMPDVVRQNLKNLLLTNPGERIMDPTFGIGIRRFLFEPNAPHIHQLIKTEIGKQVKKYMPFVHIEKVDIVQDDDDGNGMYIKIFYVIAPLNQSDSLNTQVRR